MKKLNYMLMIMAMASITSLSKAEITQVIDSKFLIYEQKQEIKLDSKFKTWEKKEKITEAYNKPGKPIKFDTEYHLKYSAQSFWTRYTHSQKTTMLHYNKKTQQFIFQENKPDAETGIDILPMLIFLTLFGILIYSLYTKNDLGILFPFSLCLSTFVLSLYHVVRLDDPEIQSPVLCGVLVAFLSYSLYIIIGGVFKIIGFKKLPMKIINAGKANLVAAYCLVVAGNFIALFRLPLAYIYIPFLIYISPYLLTWVVMIVKSIKLTESTSKKT